MSKTYSTLIPSYRHSSNGESDKAHALFEEMLRQFSYDALSKHPDYLVYASAETLLFIVPLLIEEMLRRKDTLNYLVYPIISAVDKQSDRKTKEHRERAALLMTKANGRFADALRRLFEALRGDPPIPEDEFDALRAMWMNG